MNNFVHLHIHTEYSLLDGAIRIKDLFKAVKELGMNSIAITDHGVMYGVVDFYKEAKKHGIKPIIGCEIYTAKRSRSDKKSGIDDKYGHLVLLAKNQIGYKNLMKIVSSGFIEGFYYKPRVDMEILEQYSEGIIALSACLAGDVSRAISQNNIIGAKEKAIEFNNIFGQGNFYLELQDHGIEEQKIVNSKLIEISRELNIPLVATNDSHYLRREDSRPHEILLCIQTGKNIDDEDRMKFGTDEFYVKSPQEMKLLFQYVNEALENTVKIAEQCNVEFEFGKIHLPKFDVPENKDAFEYLNELTLKGLYENYDKLKADENLERLNFELSVIKNMGYIDYFLIVWDFIRYAKDNGIMVGPGRGSAAGSIVAYCLGITDIDPIKYNLLFERFLNPERISMPDIDIDFCFERRQEVIDYVIRKYGSDRVAQIITFGTMAARAAIRDVGRALNIPYSDVDSIAKMIPMQIGMNISKALEINSELKTKTEEDSKINELINTAKLLEGMPRHASTHAAGVVISKDSVTEYVPLQLNENVITTQFTMGLLEELGLLKMDFLGLRTLTVIRDALELIKKNYNIDINIARVNFEDSNVFKMLSEGKTSGVFQLESTGMTQFFKELQPESLEDIIAGISLYRPGPMDQIPRYIKNKKNPQLVTYPHIELEKIMSVTYGCMVYQEQVMQIVRDIGGYSLGRADLVRRAMSKKKFEVMQQERKNFVHGIVDEDGTISVQGAVRNGLSPEIANKIFDEMMDFASYAFNKSHAAAYAMIAYQTAYLKYYYPVEFMAALLNSFIGNADKIPVYIDECKSLNIDILPPDVNESGLKFMVVDKKIRFGMSAVKNVGETPVMSIIRERESSGIFQTFNDFCERIDGKEMNKRCIESLIKSGAFDSFGHYRSVLINIFEKILDSIQDNRKKMLEGQISIFDIGNNSSGIDNIKFEIEYPKLKEYPQNVLLSMEKEMLGIYVSGHPLSQYLSTIKKQVNCFSKDLKMTIIEDDETNNLITEKFYDGKKVVVAGLVNSKKTITTKSNQMMAFVNLEDEYGLIEIIVFPNVLEKFSHLLENESPILIKGKLTIREDEEAKVICEDINPLKVEELKPKKLFIRLTSPIDEDKNKELLYMLKQYKGTIPVCVYKEYEQNREELGNQYLIETNNVLISLLEEKFGLENIKFIY